MSDLKKILHVDDDADIREIAQLSLDHIGGFEIEQCSSGSEALIRAPQFKPQLFLLDVMMPNMTGEMLLEELSKDPEMAEIPVIFMTAKVEQDYVKKLIAKGALAVVEKPFDPIELPDQIQEIWKSQPLHG